MAVLSLTDAITASAQTATMLQHATSTATRTGVPAAVAPAAGALPGTTASTSGVQALRGQARAAQTVTLAAQAQTAARAAAAALSSGVANGLTPGGLQPAVTAPTLASADATGLATWQGALLPTQTGKVVTVTQTDQRAVLSWTTFNVGVDTTLNFDQKLNGVAQPSWVALNRVVGQINPATGLRDAATAPAPSQILGKVNSDGEVLVLNPNGVVFGATAQVNTYSLVASSLDVGRALTTGSAQKPLSIAQRNQEFLSLGLLGYAQQASVNDQLSAFTFSAEAIDSGRYDPLIEGAITIDAGAQIASADTGFLLFTGPTIVNAGQLKSTNGEVALQSGRQVFLEASNGTTTSLDPNVRGFLLSAVDRADASGNSVVNAAGAVIQADGGYISLGSTPSGSVANAGVISSTTSISRNGYVQLSGSHIALAPGSTISITPDDSAGTIPQDPTSLADFKTSRISIGDSSSAIDIGANSVIYAPSANVLIGASPGATTVANGAQGQSHIFIDDGAIIDVAGLTDVMVSASAHSVQITPVTTNELQDSPNDKALLGATVYIDPRLSGVRSDGVAWVGSPLISAASFAQQVGVNVSQLMTTGGNVTLGVASANGTAAASAPSVVVKSGATIDISGGWVTYQSGRVETSRLVDSYGQVVDIAKANPNATYVGIYAGFTASQPRWALSQTFTNPLLGGVAQEGAYIEGRDAGSLVIKASVAALDGTVHANAYAGPEQILGATPGAAAATIYGDGRKLQAAPSQLPSGGFLSVQAAGVDRTGVITGGADIEVTSGATGSSLAGLTNAQLPTDRIDTILLSAPALTAMGLSDISLLTSGKISVDSGADILLNAGGQFDAVSGRALTIDGSIRAPAGRINLTTAQLLPVGSVVKPDAAGPGAYDITVNGQLLANGLWTNDFQAAAPAGTAFTNGGSISLTAAPRVALLTGTATVADTLSGAAPKVNTDISGSILINGGALLNLSGGGYVSETGALKLTSKGGNLTLSEATTYFDLQVDPNAVQAGAIPGFRVSDILDISGIAVVPVNPANITARVSIAPGTIRANGFAGGGTFSLTTPAFAFGSDLTVAGTQLPLDFFNQTGFSAYHVTSYGTALSPNAFDNGLGGYNALLKTQVLTIGQGQTLNLTQSRFSPLVTGDRAAALRSLSSGGDLYSVLAPETAADAWDQLPVSLTLDGLLELKVATGGSVVGAPGASLTVAQLHNQGLIRLPGGTLSQSELLPQLYSLTNAVAVDSTDQAFSQSNGRINETDPNLLGVVGSTGLLTNAQLAAQGGFYLLGDLPQGVGVSLDPGSVTDLSGVAVINPRAATNGQGVDGAVVAGGVLQTASANFTGANLFKTPLGTDTVYGAEGPLAVQVALSLTAKGASINLSGASATFNQQDASGRFADTPVWSNGGALTLGGGVVMQDVDLKAAGGAPQALGGTLTVPNLVLTQTNSALAGLNTLSADLIQGAGLSTLVDEGSLTTSGDVTLKLGRAFFLTSAVYGNGAVASQDLSTGSGRDRLAPTVSSGGNLEVDAPYIAFSSAFQSLSSPGAALSGSNSATFSASAIDITGAVLFDGSIGTVNLIAQNDLRLIGAQPWQQTFGVNAAATPNSLAGQLAVNGDLNITAAQVYPTTGTDFTVSSAAAAGTITFAKTAGSTAAAPYSAGGSLFVQANAIVQGGVVRAPLGALTLGSNAALTVNGGTFAPPTASVTVSSGSLTSVSAAGLSIPYGTTTDQTEWFFAPTNANQLTAPPAGLLKLSGAGVEIDANAKVDVSGGGDIFAYEFVPGTGGSHDVLSQLNTDAFTSNGGYQYPDHRQVYAIVPGLSDATVAAYDPIYSARYASLYGSSQVGARVYLNAGPGLAAGWYTLLPAQYAMLPGGMRVVQDTSAASTIPTAGTTLADGTIVVSGRYGVAGGSSVSSTYNTFDVQSQSTILKYSNIVLTKGNQTFAAKAALNGLVTPRLPIDAGHLVLAPLTSLSIQSAIDTTPATSGRGAEVDISGTNLDIVATAGTGVAGAIELTADALTNLNAASLFIGGQRSENSNGETDLNVTASTITVRNKKSSPLSAPEVILAVDGPRSAISIYPGAYISATGTADASSTANFVIDGSTGLTGQGALLRIANGPERLLTRENVNAKVAKGRLVVGGLATLSGQSVLLDSSGAVRLADSVKLTATNLAVDAASIGFAPTAASSATLTITRTLQTKFAAATQLTLRSTAAIDFAAGAYSFGNLNLDTPGLSTSGNGQVDLTAASLTLSNSGKDAGACDVTVACGSGSLQLTAATVGFGSGELRTYGFGALVSLTANSGVYADGAGGLDVGPATLAIATPFIGDQATPATVGSTTSAKASLTFNTSGAVVITAPSGSAPPAPAGTPGASLAIDGATIAITGTDLRATAGNLSLVSKAGIDIGGGAKLETPGYSKVFGDAADSYSINAPGGLLSLTALGGAINLASGTTLSVGGGVGNAGSLNLKSSGALLFNATLNATAPGGGGSINIDTGSSFDLSAFERTAGAAFTGDQTIRTGVGNLALDSGLTIRAANVSLTADDLGAGGGTVDIAGKIDVSGVNGGQVALYGAQGVTLEGGSLIDAHASGYASTDTRQARGGTVSIGVDNTGASPGAIQIATGAVIDVSATRPGDRLVSTAGGAYTYVQGDQGGAVNLRIPVSYTADGREDVNLTYAGQIKGAASVILQGFEHVNLDDVYRNSPYYGVEEYSPGVATLDVSESGGLNFFADNAPGTMVDFIQSFDLSAASAKLGGLTKLAGFSARPGVELDYTGDILVASNWNLGAGVVDVAGAQAAGLIANDPNLPGQVYIKPGAEAAVFSNYTTLTYRTGGKVDGQPGMLTIRAGGSLDIQGTITDGFFTFADQTDPGYISIALGGGAPADGSRTYQGYLTPACANGVCTGIGAFAAGKTLPDNFVSINFPTASGLSSSFAQTYAPYNAIANSPTALGAFSDLTGDPIGSAAVFPLIARGGGAQVVNSWSYQLVAGAGAGANPLRTDATKTAGVTVEDPSADVGILSHSYVLSATTPVSALATTLDLQVGSQILSPAAWLSAFEQANAGVNNSAYTLIDFSTAPAAIRPALSADAVSFFTDRSTATLQGSAAKPTGVATSLALAEAFIAKYTGDGSVTAAYRTPASSPYTGSLTVNAPTLIRTGTGSISIAAPGTIDLRNGATPTLETANGKTASAKGGGLQLGGVAIYTAGHLADPGVQTVTDAITGRQYVLDASGSGTATNIFNSPPVNGYRYGAGTAGPSAPGVGFTDILIANPVYLEGGGDVSLTAGGDILGRRDVLQASRLTTNYASSVAYGYSWIGQGNQPWRTGLIGASTDVRIDPQLFQEGIGTLGGGSISVDAGGALSDLSVVADTSIATAQVSTASAPSSKALLTFGGGNVSIDVGANLLGGRIDVASGQGSITVGGDIVSAGLYGKLGAQSQNTLLVRLSDATFDIETHGSALVEGVTALGVHGANSAAEANLNAMGFYSADSGVSLVADGPVQISNSGSDVLTPSVAATGGASNVVYPGSLEAVSLTGDLNLATSGGSQGASTVVLYPTAGGTLVLAAAGDIAKSVINIEDANPNLLPGAFSNFTTDAQGNALTGLGFGFADVLPNTPETVLSQLHNSALTHVGDPAPNRIYAGRDILNLTVSTPKQTRIDAGRDLINMVFLGQNLAASDITRIVAGRDITATTQLVTPVIGLPDVLGTALPAVQGNTFVIGGPGSFFLEAGRNAGPFLNSAVTNGFASDGGKISADGVLSYGGGILSIGNEHNPWLPQQGADIYTEFGVAGGQDFTALINGYLNPANFASMPSYLFDQVTNAAGISAPDRTKFIYAPILIAWLKANESAALIAAYGSTDITYDQAYKVFTALPALVQRTFLIKSVYFNELKQTSIPTGSSYLQYSRGYQVVNTLFPASRGYTSNNLTGGSNGASKIVTTGNLDLRLATIQTDQSGDIFILGPGGRVLAGSTVSTADQAARRAYVGGQLYTGGGANAPLAADISSIPVGAEGILTLQGGGIYTFTDQSFLLNQSRLFTEAGGDIVMWSSNADLNAGEGPKTSANFPPIAVTIDVDAYSQINKDANVSGAGIAAFQTDPNATPPDVFLIAPRGTVDAGAAGVRVAGNLFIAANSVANADNFKVTGSAIGIPASSSVNVGAQTSAGNSAAAAAQAAQSVAGAGGATTPRSIITVNVLGYAGDASGTPLKTCPPEDETCPRN